MMTFKEISEIVAIRAKPKNIKREYYIGVSEENIEGMEHPFWSVLNAIIPPARPWKKVSGKERTQIRRAADLLIKKQIPYFFYADFLCRFNKAGLKNINSLLITKIKDKKDGSTSVLNDFIAFVEYLVKVFQENPAIIKLVDILYAKHPSSFSLGVYKYIFATDLIKEFVAKGHSPTEVTKHISASSTIDQFFASLGEVSHNTPKLSIDLTKGTAMPAGNLKVFQKEIRIRTGEDTGTPNPALNKYFRENGKLNNKGLKILGAI